MKKPFALALLLILICGCSRGEALSGVSSTSDVPAAAASSERVAQSAQSDSPHSDLVLEKPTEETLRDLLLVNDKNPMPETVTPELVTTAQGYQLDKRAAQDWQQMFEGAKADGVNLLLCYGYRTREQAQQLFDKQINRQMETGLSREAAVEAAKRVVAPPGYSEHHTGLALDIVTPENQVLTEAFAQTEAAQWMAKNGHRYGFILRYPKDKVELTQITYEPWHMRWVGKTHAKAIYENQLCLEEYIQELQARGWLA